MSTTSPPHSEETLKRVASYLRTGRVLKTQELIMAEKRVEVFKGIITKLSGEHLAFPLTNSLA